MKEEIIKIWVCRECEKEYRERPIMCSYCNKFEFYVKYAGQLTDIDELSKLVEVYKDDEHEKNKKVRM